MLSVPENVVQERSNSISNDKSCTSVGSSKYYAKEQYLDLSIQEQEYLKIITTENVQGFEEKIKLMCNRRDSVLQSLEGKTIKVTALNIDIVNSSVKVNRLSSEQAGECYQAFIENMSCLIENYGGYVLKNVGDCVIGFFPCGSYIIENHDRAVLCGLTVSDMIRCSLNPYLKERKMPAIEARISADFGSARVLGIRTRNGYSTIDLFGGALNSAAKISRYAAPGQMVIGDNLFWQLIKDVAFEFKLVNRWDVLGKHNYPVYSIKCNNGRCGIK